MSIDLLQHVRDVAQIVLVPTATTHGSWIIIMAFGYAWTSFPARTTKDAADAASDSMRVITRDLWERSAL
jgi:hypothetical protein